MASRALSSATGVSVLVSPSLWKPRVEGRAWSLSSSAPSARNSKSSSCKLLFRIGSVRCKALGENNRGSFDDSIVYQGIYGPWTIDSSDVREVILYRSGLVTAAASFVLAASAAFLPDNSFLSTTIKQNLDYFYVAGSCGLGLSLLLIHIYVSEIKRTLQALWLLGILGSCATYVSLAQPANENLVQYVLDNPSAVWLVGPLFAALTGLVFKEGLCYGKLEAGILTFVIPIVLLGHLSGLMDDGVKLVLLATWMALFVIFAGRKFTQPIKDDIGDKSVFMFNSLRDDEKKALIEKLEQQKN
ncbi:integral membrane protein [Senna tora]|uniref:Integral membrane protein n=1 Tax=Senna tora TaxID=362788 RepID=A0A835CFC7_9FABA|nr:integral membrane protein [Senna tora]